MYVLIMLSMILAFTACSNPIDSSYAVRKEGIEPYPLSEDETYILECFGMKDISQILSFYPPENTKSLHINVYQLKDDKTWKSIGGGEMSISVDAKSSEQLAGIFTMKMEEEYAIDFNINSSGLFSFHTDSIKIDKEIVGSQKVFLQDFEQITLNKEIPVALMIYSSGTNMVSYSLQDYFQPLKFVGMDFVQAVTMTFSDEEI